MKLRLFLVISALVAIVYAVADPFLSGSPSTLPIWSVIQWPLCRNRVARFSDQISQGFGSDHVCHLGCRVDVMDTCDDLCGHNVEQRSDASYL